MEEQEEIWFEKNPTSQFFFTQEGFLLLNLFTDVNFEENVLQMFLSHFEIQQNTT